ncbi:MAG: NhaC family Na+:H+ antiporter, partial [Urechidicola sp.]
MEENKNLSEIKIEDQKIIDNKELNIWEALIPVLILMALLAYNIFVADGVWLGDYSNQYILLMGGAVAAIVGFFN